MESQQFNHEFEIWDAYSSAVMKASEKVGPAVIHLSTINSKILSKNSSIFQLPQKGIGSGLLIDSDGYVLTSAHFIGNTDKISAQTTEGEKIKTRLIGIDPISGLVILKLEGKNFPCIKPAYQAKVRVGELVIAAGNPTGLACAVTAGVISAIHPSLNLGPGLQLSHLIQTDAAINPGNSGGPLVNSKQEVIGISAFMVRGSQGLGFATALSDVEKVIEQLINDGHVFRPFLGIAGHALILDEKEKNESGRTKGILLLEVQKQSPASESGLRPMDIILNINGIPIESMRELSEVIQKAKVGERLNLALLREKKRTEAQVILRDKGIFKRRKPLT
ncbi:MAG: trypsin-like peptidase domain-containing protein [Firmicutes bacterium]|nr:trypsin-like peptidase domain-containing protein [Bacillota bacterium]